MSDGEPQGMDPQLTLLLELQDLRAQHRELAANDGSAPMEAEHFNIDVDDALERLAEKIGELEERLAPSVRSRYNRIAPNRDRVVVPVINGVCYGCFVSIATATVGDQDVHQQVQSCENCGSFIYVAD
jgi:predicted  nucleic acid-binding Zn-ribbon protein